MSLLTSKVSVIMPVYNTLKDYMTVSVNSVLQQTYGNIELIIVDDGSNADCAEYCDYLATKDERIRVLHQSNAGVSKARNNGTEIALGEYVMYVDSDDILHKDAIREGMSCLSETRASFAFAAIQHIDDYNQFIVDGVSEFVSEYYLYQGEEIDILRSAFLSCRDNNFRHIRGNGFVNRGPIARLIRKDIAQKVKFNEKLKIGEDVEWNMRLLNESVLVCFVKNVWYGYLIYQTSSLRKYQGNRAEMLEEYHAALYESNKEFCDTHRADYIYNMVVSFYSMLLYEYMSENNPKSGSTNNKEIKEILKKSPWNLMFDKQVSKSIPIQFRLLLHACKIGCGLSLLRIWKRIKG